MAAAVCGETLFPDDHEQSAGELIGEATLAMEMGATAEDFALTVHPYPTLSETLMGCAEAFYGHGRHLHIMRPARRRAAVPGS